MPKTDSQLILRKDDYNLLLSFLNGGYGKMHIDKRNADDLQAELKKAKLVDKEDFPVDVVRLNSRVRVKPEDRDEAIDLMLVTPDKADIKERRISILAPIGTALIGFRKGQQVKWQMPAGKRTFTIVEVTNEN